MFFFKEFSFSKKVLFVNVLFTLAVLAYETVYPLPIMLLMFTIMQKEKSKRIYIWLLSFVVIIGINLFLRLVSMGDVLGGDYASPLYNQPIQVRIEQSFKVLARLITPPYHSVIIFSILFVVLFVLVFIMCFYIYKRISNKKAFIALLVALFVSCLVAFTFPVSTKTSETDRLLYFPSVMLVVILAIPISFLSTRARMFYIGFLILFQLTFTINQIGHWERATLIKNTLVNQLSSMTGKKITLINVPKDREGAFVLAGVLDEALLLEGKDPQNFLEVNVISGYDLKKWEENIKPKQIASGVYFIPPQTLLKDMGDGYIYLEFNAKMLKMEKHTAEILYFDGSDFKSFKEFQ